VTFAHAAFRIALHTKFEQMLNLVFKGQRWLHIFHAAPLKIKTRREIACLATEARRVDADGGAPSKTAQTTTVAMKRLR